MAASGCSVKNLQRVSMTMLLLLLLLLLPPPPPIKLRPQNKQRHNQNAATRLAPPLPPPCMQVVHSALSQLETRVARAHDIERVLRVRVRRAQ